MLTIKKALTSSLGKKYVMGVTGLALIGFMITHLLGNLTLYWPDSTLFNAYAKGLHDFGAALYVAEIGLLLLFGVHAAMAFVLQRDKVKARDIGYAANQTSKGGESKFGLASNNMFWTGLVLLGFLIVHVLQFRFGNGIAEGYAVTIDGAESRDLYRLVYETFNPEETSGWIWGGIYVAVMIFLGLHLRHGVWSWLQSLGGNTGRISPVLYTIALALAVLLAAGFLFIPIYFLLGFGSL